MVKGNSFITGYGYLSIAKDYLDNTTDKTLEIPNNGYVFDIEILRNTISYRDNDEFYRWQPKDYLKATK